MEDQEVQDLRMDKESGNTATYIKRMPRMT